jgi:dTDP-4-amino-4,6-dideoxygalactose transaminase
VKIPISKPFFGAEEARAIAAPLETGWVVQGPYVAEFEARFAEFVGSAHAIAMTSCTTALHAALLARGIGRGDEVLVPAFTWVATANVVELVGATPVFVDVRRDTFNVDVTELERRLTPRTKAIIPVSLFGVTAPMNDIMALARARGLWVLEDCACAVGTRLGERHAGTIADASAFSFHPRKSITTGEGGMLITDDAELARTVRIVRDHGASASDLQRHLGSRPYVLPEFGIVGSNFRMTDLQGALGVEQMKRLPWILDQRAARARRYDVLLRDIAALRPPHVPSDTRHGYQAYVTWFAPEEPSLENVQRLHERRNAVMDALQQAGVATRPGTHAVHMLEFFRTKYSIAPTDYPGAYLADRLTLTLPLYAQMTDEEQDYVVDQLMRAVQAH